MVMAEVADGGRGNAQEEARRAEREAEDARWSAWMAAAQDGDADAYRRLLEALLPALRRMVRARVYDRESAEDVVQNILLSIHRARHTYRPERSFGPWMRAIARNAMIDSFRESGRRGEREVGVEWIDDLPGEPLLAPPSDAFAPPSDALDPRLQAALERLPDTQRQAVEMIQLRELSVAEAALEAGVTPGALKVRAHRGYRALRRMLGGERP
jgi:RNA polymerase sigma-70 factor (ECF subfamily)